MPTTLRHAIDHNRGLPWPLPWLHAGAVPLVNASRWLRRPRYRHTVLPLVLGALVAAILFPFDGWLGGAIDGLDGSREGVGRLLGGDVLKELNALQQFGGISSVVLVGLLIGLLDPRKLDRLWDLAAAVITTSISVLAAKMMFGRPRPRFDEPGLIVGPFGAYPLGPGEGVHYAWAFWEDISSDLWSMPSSHTSGAVALAVFLAVCYPRLKWLVVGWVAVVGFTRVLVGAHWPSDIAMGAGIGYAVSHAAVTRGWGRAVGTRLGLRSTREREPAGGSTNG
ncbi:MAG: phosphatase PAP2 family protein [Planctomycetota bacterium]